MKFIGIDIGKAGFMLCTAQDGISPRNWQTEQLIYAENPHWRDWLRLRVAGAVVAVEPTGWHYLTPVARVLATTPGTTTHLVNHEKTKEIRHAYVASAKTDAMDSRALALIARDIGLGVQIRGIRLYDHNRQSAAITLRLLVNTHERLAKQTTRLSNQLDALGHSIDPVLAARRGAWLSAVERGAISPAQIIQLAGQKKPADVHGSTWRAIRELAKLLLEETPVSLDMQTSIADLAGQLIDFEDAKQPVLIRITELIEADPFTHFTISWRSIPGADDLSIAAMLVATHGQPDMLDKNEFRAALGSSPKTEQSGQDDNTEASKKGYRPCKKYLFLWMMRLMKTDNPISAYFHAREGKISRPIYAARNKFARVLWSLARSGQLCDWRTLPLPEAPPKKRGRPRKETPAPDDPNS